MARRDALSDHCATALTEQQKDFTVVRSHKFTENTRNTTETQLWNKKESQIRLKTFKESSTAQWTKSQTIFQTRVKSIYASHPHPTMKLSGQKDNIAALSPTSKCLGKGKNSCHVYNISKTLILRNNHIRKHFYPFILASHRIHPEPFEISNPQSINKQIMRKK